MWITLLVLGGLLILDQLTKYLSEIFIARGSEVTLIPHVLDATLTYNTGAAWSFLSDHTWILAVVSFIASAVLVYFITKNNWKKKKCYSIAITLMLAGTFGNFIDRFFSCIGLRDGVVDMIIFKPLDTVWNWITKSGFPIFNVADMCLVIGIVFLAVDIIFFQEKRAKS
ncbi:MAG: signal peptidase II [Anaeroplasmataceae bacterium]|nr:signal peptidase II [Anaeroplasmataceae bacterium]MDE6241954.1 signal peptidase II [Anaeroplasmataceae bacterium]